MLFLRSSIVQLVTEDLFDRNMEVVKRAMKRLAELSTQDDECLEMLRPCLFTTIMGFVFKYSDSAEIFENGCIIFRNLIQLANEEQLHTFVQFHFVEDIVTLQLKSQDRFVLTNVLSVIGQLASKGYFFYDMNLHVMDHTIDITCNK